MIAKLQVINIVDLNAVIVIVKNKILKLNYKLESLKWLSFFTVEWVIKMNINDVRNEIAEKLETADDYKEIHNINEPYKKLLEEEIKFKPRNIEAYCLLAMVVEAMLLDDEPMDILEKCYEANHDVFSDDEYCMWATCMAYFIIDYYGCVEHDDNNKRKRALVILEEAVSRKSVFYQTYYALGQYYFENKLFDKASKVFHQAYMISKDKKYLYCEAISLLKASKLDEGVKTLESLSAYPLIEDELDFIIALTLGHTLAVMGDIEKASEIADILIDEKYVDFDGADWMLTDFMFTLGRYEYVVNYYDTNEYAESVSWRSEYFYSLKMLEKNAEALLKLESIVKEYEDEICLAEKEMSFGSDDDDYETADEKDEDIAETKEDIVVMKKCYDDVFVNNIKPIKEPYYDIVYECYYIGCPRHSSN